MRTLLRRFGALAGLVAASAVLVGGPAFASQSGQLPRAQTAVQTDRPCDVETPPSGAPAGSQPLKLCASFDKTSYQSSEIVKLTISVTNLGTAPADHVWVLLPEFQQQSWSVAGGIPGTSLASPGGIGQVIQPGVTVTSEIDGYASKPASGVVELTATASQTPYNSQSSGESYGQGVDISASVTPVTNLSYSGSVDTTAKAPLAGVTITLSGPFQGINGESGPTDHTATTDGQGHFQVTGLPGGQYLLSVSAPGGWLVSAPDYVMVDDSAADSGVAFTASRPLTETLKSTMAFDKSSYHVGDHAQLTITLHNTGATDLTGITAGCDHSGNANEVVASGPAWGALAGAGVTVPAGSTITQTVTLTVPATSLLYGYDSLDAQCYFGPDAGNGALDGYPMSQVQVTVQAATGPTIDFQLKLVTSVANAVINPNVYLIDPSTQTPIAVPELGAGSNQASFKDIPEGRYDIQLSGDWKLAPGQSAQIDTSTLTENQVVDIQVVPNSTTTTPPSSSTSPSTSPSSPSPTTAPASTTALAAGSGGTGTGSGHPLPYTGVDLVLPVLAALVLIGGGVTVMLFVRRRRATS